MAVAAGRLAAEQRNEGEEQMAKIIVENATVERVFSTQSGWGVGVYETFKRRDDTEGRTRYTLWMKGDHPGVEQGQRVSASGFLSAKVREYEHNGETRQTVDLSVNGARFISAPEDPDPAPQAFDSWTPPAEEQF
jgi:hypothetical protein